MVTPVRCATSLKERTDDDDDDTDDEEQAVKAQFVSFPVVMSPSGGTGRDGDGGIGVGMRTRGRAQRGQRDTMRNKMMMFTTTVPTEEEKADDDGCVSRKRRKPTDAVGAQKTTSTSIGKGDGVKKRRGRARAVLVEASENGNDGTASATTIAGKAGGRRGNTKSTTTTTTTATTASKSAATQGRSVVQILFEDASRAEIRRRWVERTTTSSKSAGSAGTTESSDAMTATTYGGTPPVGMMGHGSRSGATTNTTTTRPRRAAGKKKDNTEGHLEYELGDTLAGEYKILSLLGEGTFGRVLECRDTITEDVCAIKVIRNVAKYRDAAMTEIEVLTHVALGDPGGGGENFNCIKLRRAFDYEGHICMVFDKFGPSLFDFLRTNRYKPFHPQTVQSFGKQLLIAVEYLHSIGMIHTDLKPENVLLLNKSYRDNKTYRVPVDHTIRLIDFGSTTWHHRHHSAVVSTRHYRAPEIILGTGWSYPCDMWSVGCILVELLSGEALFRTHDNLEHLAMMQHALETSVPSSVASKVHVSKRIDYFDARGKINWPNEATDAESYSAVGKTGIIRNVIEKHLDGEARELFLDLITRLLEFDPQVRITSKQARDHPFFSINLESIEWKISAYTKTARRSSRQD